MNSRNLYLLIFSVILSLCCSKGQHRLVRHFEDTKAEDLARAISSNNQRRVEALVKADESILDVSANKSGINVLGLSILLEKYDAFELLLKLGANPNYINPVTNKSVLMTSIGYLGSQLAWRFDTRYAEKLLESGADPNYAAPQLDTFSVKNSLPATPLMEAASVDLSFVELLIAHGADPSYKRNNLVSAFESAISIRNYDVVNYFIDHLKVDVHEPMQLILRRPMNKKMTLYIQDLIINDYQTVAMLREGKFCKGNASKERTKLICKLQRMGVDFISHDYELLDK